MSETERAVQSLMEMTDLRPRFRAINIAGNMGEYVSNPLANLSIGERETLASAIRRNLTA
jgi:hypothetical protein